MVDGLLFPVAPVVADQVHEVVDLAEDLLLLEGVDVIGPAHHVAGRFQRGDEAGVVVDRLRGLDARYDLYQVHADVDRTRVPPLGDVRLLGGHHAFGPVPGLPAGGRRQVRGEVPGEAPSPVRRRARDGARPQVLQRDDGGGELHVGRRSGAQAVHDGEHAGDHFPYTFRIAAQLAVVELVVDEEQPDEPVGHQIQVFGAGGRIDHPDEGAEIGLFEPGSRGCPVYEAGPSSPGVEVLTGLPDVRTGPLGERAVDVRQFALHGRIRILSGQTRDRCSGRWSSALRYL
ncbi:hypothetical protein Sfulv_07680 [Streptomyces fulvorobeus]|uniref:Uncharacterized protein n=1 Tax=Streptomyces fulvorobeus TaxID=284028 RepID=A0A7J0C1Q2_9ACTN|nr:hypothetical protein Sfulv_07680 [Streptomyces fulvorobeus]